MLNVDDILDESDVLTYDSDLLNVFGESDLKVSQLLQDKRTIAVQSWLALGLEKAGYSPIRHSARRVPDRAFASTASVLTDITDSLGDKTANDLNLYTTLITPGTDYLYIGFAEPYRGLWVTMVDSLNINTLTISSPAYWTGQWSGFNSLTDGTVRSNSIAFSGSGRISWQMPTDWEKRPVNAETTWRFWMRLGLNQRPSSGTYLSQVLPIRTSRFTDPAAFYTLSLMYGESWGAQRGEWKDKAAAYSKMAQDALTETMGLTLISDEFLMEDQESVRQTDASSTTPPGASELFTWQRG